ncbi:MAG: 4-(cytidine 5'-diphospho)-2-C-methyl-D-erythritol kinase [Deltaproteobacteria bacterium]|nr:4-(cytidine 5'-diphospho)-2-C-methyl-D-erythritol kinase [Deltaproteobacteria bacterium]MBW1924930.1 4-(cytidine 5'-diphospho)-2-C-methyl-D-erythritol kinase [Deltaproteobacteria bacterium]MBW1949422.1 4-(cytidine 5'-diphospho)-2-C-methyl-D-erythritol kinase [Deltaproteobacteria bacterium]MBW2008264.1 4-(cytidine 5'-diphospho)-2-C-methyl-D-erythritol kinase [Deltaproteobacteria bacterium]MBW2101218.1 4-(cytidine 5'-diphospho)-2-C-methyl-D-erythritol kinase [Deltaproteobacteria bacterium]
MDASSLSLAAPAKLNVRLKITGRRPDGYHDLVSLMVPVDLCDRLVIRPGPNGMALHCEGRPVPGGRENLVHQAARAFFQATLIPAAVSITLIKKIPVAAGLGGGSSDAACVLGALNRLHGRPLTEARLQDLARELGADVPFFLKGRPCLARGIGDILEPAHGWPPFRYLIVTPPLAVSTAWAYDNVKLKKLTSNEYDYIVRHLRQDRIDVSAILENDLEAVTASRFPVIDTIKRCMMEAGANGALMTGSGPSVFGIFDSTTRALAAREVLIRKNVGEVFSASPWKPERA